MVLIPRHPSVSALLKSCSNVRTLEHCHATILKNGLHQDNVLITKFLGVCSVLRRVNYAKGVFDAVSQPNIYLWNSMIKGYCENCSLGDTILLFREMQLSNVRPDDYTFPSILKSCANELALRSGQGIHCVIVKVGCEVCVFVGTGLIDFYGKCGEIESARHLFDRMPDRNVVSLTAIIVGYAACGDMRTARELFDQMPRRNLVTWNAMIAGYAKIGEMGVARRLFDEMPARNVISFTTMIDGYSKNGDMVCARSLFDQLGKKDLVSWSALISGYVQNGQPNEALEIFFLLQSKNIKPDEFVMVSLMSACAQLGRLDLARWIDSYIVQGGMDLRAQVMAGLVDMHAKCGNMDRALQLFDKIPRKNLVSYSALMLGLSLHGQGKEAVELFSQMLKVGIVPDAAAFTIVLTACSHAGLFNEGCHYFECMIKDYNVTPSADHYACMVDLLCRGGRLKDAYELIKIMPVELHAGAWGSLLGACRVQCDIELGEIVARRLFSIEPNNAGNYILLSNIYAAANRWSDVSDLRTLMREKGVKKIPGRSWI
ncbi:putative pentatricopeptide repeat-containing protein At5g37570 [Nymphaea colorata]|uniref:Pentacotripeptide-repeat region of PRORP domain-containing protein n=1 Tax=Nymphaea colorata TaxID=210225 RepID=A0A5K0V9Q4_9MAGN|nr:putative pentatricopeptide repeat-containing protein At5g37570 [Nymphaea colorata]